MLNIEPFLYLKDFVVILRIEHCRYKKTSRSTIDMKINLLLTLVWAQNGPGATVKKI